jgi:hypothetical protein
MKQEDMDAYRYWLGIAGIIFLVIILGTIGVTWLLN